MIHFESKSYPLSHIDIICLISVCLLFLWRPLNVWYLSFDAAARIPVFLILFLTVLRHNLLLNTNRRTPSVIYAFVACYMVLNGFLMGSASTYPRAGEWLIFTHIFIPFLSLLHVSTIARTNFQQTVRILTVGLLLYCLLALINSTINERGRLDSEINANEMALYGAITTGLILLQYIRGDIKNSYLFALVLPIFMIIQTGSRMGFAMISIMLSSSILISANLKRAKTFFLLVAVLICVFFLVNHILFNTVLGERLLSTTEQSEIEQFASTGTILDYYGDRGYQYYSSWPYFISNPIFGIGFHRWMVYSPSGHVCHSEFLTQYLECGLVSFIPWISFWIIMCRQLFLCLKLQVVKIKRTAIFLLVILFTLFYADTVLWSYDQYCVFLIYALAISYPRIIYYAR